MPKKENEKTEKIIRGLLKSPENRSCINCNTLGPQYVCTTFRTFVCTNCSGIHREFTHRVKSISMAKFTADEVEALQAGGNERAREIYFRGWDFKSQPLPDSSNLRKLRDFVKRVYVDRMYTGERRNDYGRPSSQRVKVKDESMASRNERGHSGRTSPSIWNCDDNSFKSYLEGRRNESLNSKREGAGASFSWKDEERSFRSYLEERIGQISPKYERGYRKTISGIPENDERNFKYHFNDRRSLANSRNKKNTVKFEIVDDRFRDDRPGNVRTYNFGRRPSDGDKSRSLLTHPIRQNSGDTASLQDESQRMDNGGNFDESAHDQNVAPSNSPSSNSRDDTEKPPVERIENTDSLIDFDTDINPPNALAAQHEQIAHPPSSTGNLELAAPDPNSLEALLFGVPDPSSVPLVNESEATSGENVQSYTNGEVWSTNSPTPTMSTHGMLAIEYNTDLRSGASDTSGVSPFNINNEQQHSNRLQHQHQPCPSPAAQQAMSLAEILNNQPWVSSPKHAIQESSSPSTELAIVPVSLPAHSIDTMGVPGSDSMMKSSERKELPMEVFTATYSPVPQHYLGRHTGPQQNMGYNMQYYPTSVPAPSFSGPAKSSNPFDFDNEFPSMAPLQGALPDPAAPSNMMSNSSFAPNHQALMLPQSPFYAYTPPKSGAFGSIMSLGPQMEQHAHNYMPPSSFVGFSGLGNNDGAVVGSFNTNQDQTGIFSAPAPIPKQGNPFG